MTTRPSRRMQAVGLLVALFGVGWVAVVGEVNHRRIGVAA